MNGDDLKSKRFYLIRVLIKSMPYTLNYQALVNAVEASTGARGSVYPNDYNYVALPLRTVQSMVSSLPASSGTLEAGDCDDRARRLWFRLKEEEPLSACGMIRLSAPVAHDIVGVITEEDLLLSQGAETGRVSLSISREGLLREGLLGEDLPEYQGEIIPAAPSISAKGQVAAKVGPLEMTLIEPATKEIFKRSQGGHFGKEGWPVAGIRAFAVWF